MRQIALTLFQIVYLSVCSIAFFLHSSFISLPSFDFVQVGDAIAEPYKRKPIICEQDRATIVRAIRWVDEVVVPSPLVITEEYVKEHRIDLIVHGFCDERDKNNFYKRHSQVAELEGLELREIPYTSGVSTSQLIAQLSKL